MGQQVANSDVWVKVWKLDIQAIVDAGIHGYFPKFDQLASCHTGKNLRSGTGLKSGVGLVWDSLCSMSEIISLLKENFILPAQADNAGEGLGDLLFILVEADTLFYRRYRCN